LMVWLGQDIRVVLVVEVLDQKRFGMKFELGNPESSPIPHARAPHTPARARVGAVQFHSCLYGVH